MNTGETLETAPDHGAPRVSRGLEQRSIRHVQDRAEFQHRLTLDREAIAAFLSQRHPLLLLTGMRGNIGDHLIWAGTKRLLALSGLSYQEITCEMLLRHTQPMGGTLIIPGSGAFTERWHEWLPALVISASPLFDRIIILPSEFEPEVPIVREALQLPNVYSFAREPHSYEKIKAFGKAALAFDPALWAMDFFSLNTETPDADGDLTASKPLLALRTDQGSLLAEHRLVPADHNNDISVTCDSLTGFLNQLQSIDTVITDRLHVTVAAVMLGRTVQFIDPYSNKISRYIRFNFGQAFSVQLTYRSIEWLKENQHVHAQGDSR